jgi:hypothetical protein
MLSIFRRSKVSRFNIAAIGDNWLHRPITHEGKTGVLHVRQVPSDVKKADFPFVSLAQSANSLSRQAIEAQTKLVQRALERDGACLLVLAHEVAGAVTWYAYASTQKALDAAFASLSDPSIRWAGGEDKGWLEFEHARGLVGA